VGGGLCHGPAVIPFSRVLARCTRYRLPSCLSFYTDYCRYLFKRVLDDVARVGRKLENGVVEGRTMMAIFGVEKKELWIEVKDC